MPPSDIKSATRQEWRDLGYFYDLDDSTQCWRIIGSKAGLNAFADQLRSYAVNPRNARTSEHDHLGPYAYLKIGTWTSAVINGDWIAGPLADLERFAGAIERSVASASSGDVLAVSRLFSDDPCYELELVVRPDDFDPAEEDPQCK